MAYPVGVDLGQTHAAAAVCRAGHAEIVPLGARAAFVPSVVFVPAVGQWLVGEDADRLAPTDPGRVARQFTRRIGDGAPLLIGGVPVAAEVLAAHFVSRVLDSVAERVGGATNPSRPTTPAKVAITHPAGWGAHRLAALREAMAGNGLGGALLLSEPQAAVLAHASREPLEPGRCVAVYDLGGAGFGAAVVRRDAVDRFTVIGRPEEMQLGGLDFDEVVFEHVTSTLGPAWEALDPADPAVLTAVAGLRRNCTAAKEALSADTDVLIPVALPGIQTEVRLGRAEFEELIRPGIEETVAALHRAIGSAGLAADELATVLLVGGSARIPLITQTVSAQLRRPVSVGSDPKGIVAIGAALAAHGVDAEPTRAIPMPAPALLGNDLSAPPGARPPIPLAQPPSPRRRTLVTAMAAGVLAIAAVGGLAVLTDRTTPVDADADPVTNKATSTVQHPTSTSADPTGYEQTTPTPTTTVPPRRATNPPRTGGRTTTTPPPKTTTSSTSSTTSSPTTTTTTTKAGAR